MEHKNREFGTLDSNKLIAILRKSSNNQQRSEASWSLGKRRERKAIPDLLRALKDNSTEVRWEAAKALAAISHSDSIKPLIQIMRRGKAINIRHVATYALSFMFSKRSVQAAQSLLCTLNDKKENTVVRGQAAEGLGNLLYRPALNSLIVALNDKNVAVRFWSVFALGMLGDKRALPKLKEMTQRDSGNLSGWGSIKKEARNAIKTINERNR